MIFLPSARDIATTGDFGVKYKFFLKKKRKPQPSPPVLKSGTTVGYNAARCMHGSGT
jgi:hypothetical protein